MLNFLKSTYKITQVIQNATANPVMERPRDSHGPREDNIDN